MPRKAKVIGIDHYDRLENLNGCVNDARSIREQLRFNADKSENFEVDLITSNITTERLHREVENLFAGTAETVVFYFAGHGVFDSSADFGFLVSQDGSRHSWGLNFDTLLGYANDAYPEIRNTVIILDCCYSGRLGDPGIRQSTLKALGKGITIMTACNTKEVAMEYGGKGLFTSMLVDGLRGEAADIEGNITPAMLYAHVDRRLGAFEQRPLYKANLQEFNVLRRSESRVCPADLRLLARVFADSDHYHLGPECEPYEDRGSYQTEHKNIDFDQAKHDTYRALQRLVHVGLVSPNIFPHMWDAAMTRKGCSITNHGKHYRYLAAKEKFGPL